MSRLGFLVGVGIACLIPGTVRAADFTWNTGNGNWNTTGNWTPAGPPA